MRFRDYVQRLSADEKKALADKLEVSLGYLYRLKGGFASPSFDLAARIQTATMDSVRLQDWAEEKVETEKVA